ncbi:MAG: DUF4124 domain-containing protein [Chitinophagaceae bacterium]|nr:MAG: DUF4124 domain-containing protein [Chitinophagaceae bacterium]
MLRAVHAKGLSVFLILLSACTASLAATYRCTNGTTRYYSDKPCPSGDLRFMGPSGDSSSSRSSYRNYHNPEAVVRAPEHMKYLSGECAQLNDAIRTAPTRGIGRGVINELRMEYDRKCGDEDRDARSQLRDDADQIRSQRRADQAAKQRALLEADAKAEQCNAMRDVIQSRRRRLDTMAPRDVAAFHDAEIAFNERCLGR